MIITKAGALASFYTVNKAPIKHLRVYFSPKQAGSGDPSPTNVREISGWDGIQFTQCKKNLLNPNILINDKWIDSAGVIQTASAARLSDYIPINGKCTFSGVKTGSSGLRLILYDENKNFIRREVKTGGNNGEKQIITINDNNVRYVRTSTFTNSNPTPTLLLETNLEVTEFEPYEGQSNSFNWSDTLGTIYGGYVDLVTGELVQTHNHLILNGSEQGWVSANSNRIYYIEIPEMKSGVWYTDSSSLCNYAKKVNSSTDRYFECLIGYNNNKRIYFYNAKTVIQDVSNLESFKAWLSTHNVMVTYPMDIPITHQLTSTQLSTLIGCNNIWSNADRVEVEYELAESNDELYRRRNIILQQPHPVTSSGNTIILPHCEPSPLKSCVISFSPIQGGTGTPGLDNIRPISGISTIDVSIGGTSISADLGRTCYAGTLDLISGTLTLTHTLLTFNTADMDNSAEWPGWRHSGATDIMGPGLNTNFTSQMLNIGTTFSVNTDGSGDELWLNKAVYNKTQDEWKALAMDVQVLIPYKTPRVYQLTSHSLKALRGATIITTTPGTIVESTTWSYSGQATYTGIPVFKDNACFKASTPGNRSIDNYEENDEYFIAGPFDTGSSQQKIYAYARADSPYIAWRIFNDIDGNDIEDYWSIHNNKSYVDTRTISSLGRYVYASIKKSQAANMFMYIPINEKNIYLYKGNNVTTEYGGLPVYIDNTYLPRSGGGTSDAVYDTDWFITGWFDTGDSESKSYTFYRPSRHNLEVGSAWRIYNSKSDNSVDWWSAAIGPSSSTQTITSTGRYVLFSVPKEEAANMYLYCNTTGKYIFKGNNVT